MNEKVLRVGVAGLGDVARVHLEAYRGIEGMQIVAGADIDSKRLARMSRRFAFRPYVNVRRMLQQESLDAVCVLTPAATHPDVTVACASAGVHVLCEKPIAVTIRDAESMVRACRDNGVKFMYGSTYRHMPAIIEARKLIRDGAIGDVALLSETRVGGSGLRGYRPYGPNHYAPGGPGGPGMGLVDHGIHLIDTFSWLLGRRIIAVTGRGIISGQTPVTEYMLMHFEDGALGHLLYNDFSFFTDLPNHGMFSLGAGWDDGPYSPAGSWLSHPATIHAHGTEGALRISYYAHALHQVDSSGVRQIELPDRPPPAHFAVQMEAFLDCIRNDTPPSVDGTAGVRALRALLAAYESDHLGNVVTIHED